MAISIKEAEKIMELVILKIIFMTYNGSFWEKTNFSSNV